MAFNINFNNFKILDSYAFVAHSAIHFPWQTPTDSIHRQPGQRYSDVKGPRSKLGPHTGDVGAAVREMIEALDRSVGRIVDSLKAQGLERRTLVFLTSDNGGILSYAGGHTHVSSNGPLRAAKGSLYEGGHRVPAIAWWPGRIQPGATTDATALSMDLLPTFLELAGIELPAPNGPRQLDGISLVPLLFSGKALAERNVFWRQGVKAVRRGPWKLFVPQDRPPELYNLSTDVGEKLDLASAEASRVAAMQTALRDWEKSIDSPP